MVCATRMHWGSSQGRNEVPELISAAACQISDARQENEKLEKRW